MAARSGPALTRAACVQMTALADRAANVSIASALITEAAGEGASFIATPEVTTGIYPNRDAALADSHEMTGHPAVEAFGRLAGDLGIWLSIGSISVRVSETHLANRSLLYTPSGKLLAWYDKIHMFDVNVADGQTYRESRTYRPGERTVLASTPLGGLGLTICYDMRFPYLYRRLAAAGARAFTIPAAFTVPTGKAHWETLLRARAIENGCFVIAAAQVGEHAGGRRTYGHSMIVDPWGAVLAEAGTEPGVIYAEIDPGAVERARHKVPSLENGRELPAEVDRCGVDDAAVQNKTAPAKSAEAAG